MTVEQRLAIMRSPTYESILDLVVEAPDSTLVAFCICQLEKESDARIIGYTDPIGTHPRYQKKGLAKALVTCGLNLLRDKGASIAKLSTSSKNLPMQRLAESLEFNCIAEQLWFNKEVT
jgi:ribosomal protein S18 acetylase RimI-like enzyme